MKALHVIEEARDELLAFRPEKALKKIMEFEQLILSGQVRKEHAARCTAMLHDIQILAGAARDGVAAAQRQLVEIGTLSRHLETYDRQGRKIGNRITRRQEKRF